MVLVGNNIVLRANPNSSPRFWIMLGTVGTQQVESAFKDAGGNEYVPADLVIGGFCYERLLNPRSQSYFLSDDKLVVYVYTNLICSSKFFYASKKAGLEGAFFFLVVNHTCLGDHHRCCFAM